MLLFKMETNASSEKIFDQSFRKKEATFCDKCMFYCAAEGRVDSFLNESAIHTINNDSPEFSSMLQTSANSHTKCVSHQNFGDLPEAKIVLERLPQALIHKHTYSDNVIECCLMSLSNVPQNTDKACSLSNSSYRRKISKPELEQTYVVKKNKYPLRKSKVSSPKPLSKQIVSLNSAANDAFLEKSSKAPELSKIVNNVKTKTKKLSAQNVDQNLDQQSYLENSFAKPILSKEIKTAKFPEKNKTADKENVKIAISDAPACIVSQVNCSEVSFDKYPCVHLEKLNLGPCLNGSSCLSEDLQSKKDESMNFQLEIGNASDFSTKKKTSSLIENVNPKTDLSMTKTTLPLIKDVNPKTVIYKTRETSSLTQDAIPKTSPSKTQITLPQFKNVSPKAVVSKTQKNASLTQNVMPKTNSSKTKVTSPQSKTVVSKTQKISSLTQNVFPKTTPSKTKVTLPQLKNVNPKAVVSETQKTLALIEEIGPKIGLSVTKKAKLNEKVKHETVNLSPTVEDDSSSSDAIFSEEIHPASSLLYLQDLMTRNLDEESSSDDSIVFDQENHPEDTFVSQNESIVKDTNCNDSSPHKNAQNKFPVVLLERLPLPLLNHAMNSTESMCPNSVSTVNDACDLPIKIQNVCSISKENFNGMRTHKRKPSKNNFNRTQKRTTKQSSNQSFRDKFNEGDFSVVKPKSEYVVISDSSSDSNNFVYKTLYTRVSASSEDSSSSENDRPLIMLSKQKSSFPYSSNESEDSSSSENDRPLIMLSKQKSSFPYSSNVSEDSSSDNISLINLKTNVNKTLTSKIKNSHVKSCKHIKKNFTNCNTCLKSTAKHSQGESRKRKRNNSFHSSSECSSARKKSNSKSEISCAPNKVTNKTCNKSVELLSSKKKKNSKKSLRKKQMKIYKMITKYLKMELESKKRKNKSKKRKSSKSEKLGSSYNESDTESADSDVALVFDAVEQDHSYSLKGVQDRCLAPPPPSPLKVIEDHSYARMPKLRSDPMNKGKSTSTKKISPSKCSSTPKTNTKAKKTGDGESSVSEKDDKVKKRQKSIDKYRLGFLSNKFSLRYYNRFLASERLLLSKCQLKKNKKKEVKRLFNRLKSIGLMSLK